jgi:uncharacterized membrane-anchored protein YhcB (DUF1043 family)
MAIWISTAVLVLVLIAIVFSEIRYGRRSKKLQRRVDEQIDELAQSTYSRHRDLFGKDPTGAYPLISDADVKK